MSDIFEDEHIVHMLEEAEKAMRLWDLVRGNPDSEGDVRVVVDALFRDLGRLVYNHYWEEPLLTGEEGAAMAVITSEEPTEETISQLRDEPPSEESPPGFGPKGLQNKPADHAIGGWYDDEQQDAKPKPLFTPEDGLEEDLP